MTLGAQDFIRRFLLHVLHDRFQKIRYLGFLANRHRASNLSLCRRLIGRAPLPVAPVKDWKDRYRELTGLDHLHRDCKERFNAHIIGAAVWSNTRLERTAEKRGRSAAR